MTELMTDAEKTANYTRFIEANGWAPVSGGMWQLKRGFACMSLEGAYQLQTILCQIDEDASATPTLASGDDVG